MAWRNARKPISGHVNTNPVSQSMRLKRPVLFRQLTLLLPGLALSTLLSHAAHAGSQDMVVFGDSLSDTGLVWQHLQATQGRNLPVSPPYADGRFSNGPVAVEYMARALGAKLENHAWGGATTGEDNILDTAGELAHTGVSAQVRQYLLGASSSTLDADTLYVLWAGGNDLIFDPSSAMSAQAGAQLLASAQALYDAGARHLMLPLMPDLSLMPLLNTSDARETYHAISLDFNARLQEGLVQLQSTQADAVWQTFDTPGLIGQLMQEGGLNTTQACVKGSFTRVQAVCDAPTSYVYWDSSHFTTGVHARLGEAMAAAVPENTSALQLIWGLGVLAGLIRQRHRDS